MKKCELCKCAARIFCDSDQANLCWDCDARVHSANFLVAKHSRTLLCQSCQSLTPWTGSGPKLGPTVSVCQPCFAARNSHAAGTDHDHLANAAEEENGEDESDRTAEEEEEEDDDDEDDDDDGDNQVVPFSSASNPLLQPPSIPSTSASSSEDSSSRFYRETDGFLPKRTEENASFQYDGIERPEEKTYQRMRSWSWR